VLFWITDRTSAGNSPDARFGRGWTDGTNQAAAATAWDDGTDVGAGVLVTNRTITLINDAGTVLADASIVSLNSDGFTINWNTAGGSRLVTYLALGGSDLTNVHVGNKVLLGTNATESVSGLGFQPDGILLMGPRDTSPLWFGPTQEGHTFGAAVSTTSRHTNGNRERSTGNGFSGYRSDRVLAPGDDSNQPEVIWDLQSLSVPVNDGFTLVRDTLTGTSDLVMAYLALKGMNIAEGTLSQPTSTGNQSISSLTFQPSVVLFDGADKVMSGPPPANYESPPEQIHGVATSSTARAAFWIGEGASAEADTDFSTSAVIRSLTAGTPTVQAVADFVSMNSNGFTINWTTADANQRKIG